MYDCMYVLQSIRGRDRATRGTLPNLGNAGCVCARRGAHVRTRACCGRLLLAVDTTGIAKPPAAQWQKMRGDEPSRFTECVHEQR